MKRFLILAVATVSAYVALFGQAAPVVGADDPAPLFTDKDPVLNKNKQAAMHIVFDLLGYNHWDEAPKWLTEKYIQHNPGFASGRQTVMDAFSKFSKPSPIPASTKDYATKIVAVLAQGDLVAVVNRVERPDPRNPGKTYTTTHYDMWRFVDGKADEHWDEGAINAPGGAGKGGPGGPGGPG
ncbi:MAG: nuclear transport factor 2 family protein, partial [Acidobacteriota bacterium]